MVKKKISGKDDDARLFAFLGIFLTVLGFILVYATRKDDKYAMYYGKQGLVLFISWVFVCIISAIVIWVPIFGQLIAELLQIAMVLLWITGMIYSLSGKMKPIPLVGEFADKINLQ